MCFEVHFLNSITISMRNMRNISSMYIFYLLARIVACGSAIHVQVLFTDNGINMPSGHKRLNPYDDNSYRRKGNGSIHLFSGFNILIYEIAHS